MKPCIRCGRPLPDDASLCSACWQPVEPSAPAAPAARYVARIPAPPRPSPGHWAPAPEAGAWQPPAGTVYQPPPPPVYDPTAPAETAGRSSYRWFFENITGFILMGFILAFALIVGGQSSAYFSAANLRSLLQSFCVLAPYAAGLALTARTCGPDLSMGAVALYSAMLMAAGAPFPLALLAGIIAGFINGVLVWLFKLPALIVTLVTGQILLGAVYFSTGMQAVVLEGGRQVSPAIFFAVALFTLAAGFIYVCLTPAGTPFDKRPAGGRRPLTFLFAYPLAGVLAAFGGVLAIMRLGAFVPGGGLGYGGTLVDLLFIWAAIASSRLLDNRVAPVLYAALAAFVLALLDNGMAFAGFDTLIQGYLKAVLCLLMLFCAGLARWPFGKNQPTLYSPGT